jgi:hypothetical protein
MVPFPSRGVAILIYRRPPLVVVLETLLLLMLMLMLLLSLEWALERIRKAAVRS